MKIAFITSGILPVPSVRGGAVETLADALVYENEKNSEDIAFTFFSVWDPLAEKNVHQGNYKKCTYEFIKIPTIVSFFDKGLYFVLNNIFKVTCAKKIRFLFQRLYFIWRCHLKLKKQILYDKIIVENHPSLLSAICGTSYQLGRNVIYYAHNDIKATRRNVNLLRKCFKVIVVSKYLGQAIRQKLGDDTKEQNVFILKNGVNLKLFHPFSQEERERYRNELGYSKKDQILLFTGRLVPEKGIQYLIEAFKKVSDCNAYLKLLIVGANSFDLAVRTNFEKQLSAIADSKESIRFTGFIPNDRLPVFYNIADIVILPSVWNEPAGLTMVEALACGTALITTNTGGIPEYVADSFAVRLEVSKEKFPMNLENAMRELIQDKAKRKLMARQASQAVNYLSYENYYRNFCCTIKEIN